MTKQPAEVQRAFKRIIDRANVLLPPNRLTTDAGGEFADVKKYMEKNRRTYRVRKSLRSLATIDNAIGQLKKALARDLRKSQTDDWAARLQKVVKGQNNIPKDYLDGAEPEDVTGNLELKTKLQVKIAVYYDINKRDIAKRATQLEAAGQYRSLLNRGKFNRGWQPNWGDKVHTVASVDFDKVKDPAGQTSLTKQVLPVTSFTEIGPARQIERGGNVEQTARSRTTLQTFADNFFYGNGGENQGKRMTLAQAAGVLNKMRGFNAALMIGRINMKSPDR